MQLLKKTHITLSSLRKKTNLIGKALITQLNTRPLLSFFVFLGILLGLIALSSFIRKPVAPAVQLEAPATVVSIYQNGKAAQAEFVAKVEKGGVMTIVAQTPGVVQKVSLQAGQKVSRGQSILSLSSTYAGGSPATVSRQLAQKSADFAAQTYSLQMEIVQKQRDLAEKGNSQAVDLREIGRQSLDDTRGLISLNEQIFDSLDAQITHLEATNVGGANDAAILGAKQGKAAALAGLTQLRSGLRTAEYQTSDDEIPSQLADTSRDLTLKQLDLQQQSLTLAKDVSELNLKLARLGESLLYPTSPSAGVVERVFVKVGDTVNPGTPLAVIRANTRSATAIVSLPGDMARQVSPIDASSLTVAGQTITLPPSFISKEATEGSLYSVSFSLPDQLVDQLTDGDFIPVQIPFAAQAVTANSPGTQVPLDSVYQAQDSAFVYVIGTNDGKTVAKAKTVSLGAVSGSYVEVRSGLNANDQVILTRGVSDNQVVQVK